MAKQLFLMCGIESDIKHEIITKQHRGLKMSIGATKTTLSKRAEIEKHTKEFLKNGGKITRIPSTTKTIDVAAKVFVYSDGAAQRQV